MAPDVARRADSNDGKDSNDAVSAVRLSSVTVTFGGLVALGDVDLDVQHVAERDRARRRDVDRLAIHRAIRA